MAYRDLQAFIAALEKRGELMRISAPVSPILEITEIAGRVMKRGGPALLFERVEGSDFPLLINAMGSDARMALALGAESLDEIGGDVARYLDFGNYTSLGNLVRFAPHLLRLAACFPHRHRLRLARPPCQQVIERSPTSRRCRCSTAGRRTAAASSPCRSSSRSCRRADAELRHVPDAGAR